MEHNSSEPEIIYIETKYPIEKQIANPITFFLAGALAFRDVDYFMGAAFVCSLLIIGSMGVKATARGVKWAWKKATEEEQAPISIPEYEVEESKLIPTNHIILPTHSPHPHWETQHQPQPVCDHERPCSAPSLAPMTRSCPGTFKLDKLIL